jgi:oligosaccharide reducing-end xylanase
MFSISRSNRLAVCGGALLGFVALACSSSSSSAGSSNAPNSGGAGAATAATGGAPGDAAGGLGGTTGGALGAGAGGSAGIVGNAGAGGVAGAATGGTSGAGGTGAKGTPDLFTTLIGQSETDVDTKVTTAVDRFFGIGTGEPATLTAASGYRCYYELPQDSTMAFIWAPDSNDIRSEGMSYGMMIAVQMNLQDQFDKLWNFAKTYSQYSSTTTTTAWKYYFRWQGTVDTTNAASWVITYGATTVPAPDGDQYFAAALYLADKRWGSAGTVNYKQEADNIATAMLHNAATSDSRDPLINATADMAVFVPYGASDGFTDPSYHLPAFYELFALYGPAADSAAWKALAATSRSFLVSSANATTGLHPDYATFAGAPTTAAAGDGHDQFQYDAWRVVMNMAVDYVWFGTADPRMRTQVDKYQTFFANYLGTDNVTNSLFYVDGTMPSGGGSTALTGTLAAGSLASDTANRNTYVTNLWGVAQQSGTYRYYQEGVYLLALLNVAGRFNYAF